MDPELDKKLDLTLVTNAQKNPRLSANCIMWGLVWKLLAWALSLQPQISPASSHSWIHWTLKLDSFLASPKIYENVT